MVSAVCSIHPKTQQKFSVSFGSVVPLGGTAPGDTIQGLTHEWRIDVGTRKVGDGR